MPDTKDFAGGGVSAALDASCSVLAVLDCIAALEPGQTGTRAASRAMEAALAATETAEMIDEHRTSQDGPSATESENARQATLLALIDGGSDAAIVLARARELGASGDLVQLSYPPHP